MSEHSKIVSLGDVVIERSERVDDPSSTGISRFIGLEHFDSGRLSINRFGTTDDLESAMKICRAGDTLLARRNVYLKRASMTEFDAICSGDAIVLHETPDLVPGFLPIILNSTDFWDYANENADGSMSKRLSVKHLKGYQFHLPSKDEQLRVVNLVWKLERLDSSLSSMLSDLDLCIKSRFIEMFNSSDFNRVCLKDVCSIITDGTHQPPKFEPSGIPFLFVSNIVDDCITYKTEKYISEEVYNQLIKRTPVEVGDILLTTVGSYGHPAIVNSDQKFCFQRHIAYLKPDKSRISPIYLHQALRSDHVREQIELEVRGIAQKTLNS